MHNNFYFLRQISKDLESKIVGSRLISCFTQNKNELILELSRGSYLSYIRINTLPELSCISFPNEFNRTKKNSVNLFDEIKNLTVTTVVQFENDRSLGISFDDYHLAILLHGTRSNVVLFKGEEPLLFFNKKLSRGFNKNLKDLNLPLDFSFDRFQSCDYNLKKTIPTFDQILIKYLENKGFHDLSHEDQWQLVESLLVYLDSPTFYLTIFNNKPELSLVEIGAVKEKLENSMDAANAFFHFFTSTFYFENTKNKLLKDYEAEIKRTKSYLLKSREKLDELLNNNRYDEYANILMANLSNVRSEDKTASLYDFYHNKEITIPLKDGLSPQKNAEIYYRKAKNKKLEVSNLEESISQKELRLFQIEDEYLKLKSVSSGKELKIFTRTVEITKLHPQEEEIKPYKRVEYEGFTIFVGKNAKSNDELLQNHTFKDDLWLHAKDVTGSHVILKYKSGNNFPVHVIERAAEIAAYNSKRKTDSHCPVIYTPRKFVRKQKGMAPGAVTIDKEKIIMVTPKGF
ncbi:MAG TPA: NFACT RNA binding domain-containing protein [Cytophagales bacterium]|nr:NFACT RNA binding domain-containing protein [Cytophagales bacterium]